MAFVLQTAYITTKGIKAAVRWMCMMHFKAHQKYDLLNAQQFVTGLNDVEVADSTTYTESYNNLSHSVDWQDALYRAGLHRVNIRLV